MRIIVDTYRTRSRLLCRTFHGGRREGLVHTTTRLCLRQTPVRRPRDTDQTLVPHPCSGTRQPDSGRCAFRHCPAPSREWQCRSGGAANSNRFPTARRTRRGTPVPRAPSRAVRRSLRAVVAVALEESLDEA